MEGVKSIKKNIKEKEHTNKGLFLAVLENKDEDTEHMDWPATQLQ